MSINCSHDFAESKRKHGNKTIWDRRLNSYKNAQKGNGYDPLEKDKRRKSPDNSTPYFIAFRYGENDKEYIESIRNFLKSLDLTDETNWENNSMLLRKIIKLAFVFTENQKITISEDVKKEVKDEANNDGQPIIKKIDRDQTLEPIV